ncbi:MAG: methionine--tRNA ligase [Actinobacteria bacterium]|nr:methionine--tRNA ligase [Actinomycetota bacterium]
MAFYITTPIYYVNDVPHLGHAYTTLAADALARFHRLLGEDVHFLTGTDEHGQKVMRTAEEQGTTPREWADSIVPRWHEVWDLLDITNDDFIRTTEDRHTARVQDFVQDIYDKGDIYKGTYEGPYCVSCEEFKEPGELLDGELCPIHERPVEHLEEDNWFFRLSAYQDRLLELYDQRPDFVRPEVRLNEVRSFVADGLKDLSLSRSSFDWGVPVPWDPDQVIYVWIDALQNYITAAGYGADPERFAQLWPADVHLIGKDILRFHAVIWPAMLMAAGIEPPRQVWAHGFLLAGGKKMSKTGSITAVHPREIVETYGADTLRYYFLREISFGQDGNFSFEALHDRYTTDLANDLGNLVNRVLNMAERYLDGVVPEPTVDDSEAGRQLAEDRRSAVDGVTSSLGQLDFRRALEDLWVLVRGANRYVDTTTPWALNKEGRDEELATAMYTLLDTLRATAVLVSWVLPRTAAGIWAQLGLDGAPSEDHLPGGVEPGRLPAGTRIAKGHVLFPRVELDDEDADT